MKLLMMGNAYANSNFEKRFKKKNIFCVKKENGSSLSKKNAYLAGVIVDSVFVYKNWQFLTAKFK